MPPPILLMRHGETVWNVERRMQGRLDSPLTWRGIQQARQCGEKLEGHVLTKDVQLVSSPLTRCWQTAAIVADCLAIQASSIRLEPELREISWGDWDGLTADQIEAKDPKTWQKVIESHFGHAPPNGDTLQQTVLRAKNWLNSLTMSETLIVVSHGMFGKALRCAFQGLEIDRVLAMSDAHTDVYELVDGRVNLVVS